MRECKFLQRGFPGAKRAFKHPALLASQGPLGVAALEACRWLRGNSSGPTRSRESIPAYSYFCPKVFWGGCFSSWVIWHDNFQINSKILQPAPHIVTGFCRSKKGAAFRPSLCVILVGCLPDSPIALHGKLPHTKSDNWFL